MHYGGIRKLSSSLDGRDFFQVACSSRNGLRFRLSLWRDQRATYREPGLYNGNEQRRRATAMRNRSAHRNYPEQ
jgi:hypothetical protein